MLYWQWFQCSVYIPVDLYITDICCGRFRTVIGGMSFILIFFVSILVLCLAWGSIRHPHSLMSLDPFEQVLPFYIIGFGTVPFLVVGIAAYQANFIQFGLDQLLDAPSIQLSLFIHLAIWSDNAGTTLMTISGAVLSNLRFYLQLYQFYYLPACFPLILILSCWKRQRHKVQGKRWQTILLWSKCCWRNLWSK